MSNDINKLREEEKKLLKVFKGKQKQIRAKLNAAKAKEYLEFSESTVKFLSGEITKEELESIAIKLELFKKGDEVK